MVFNSKRTGNVGDLVVVQSHRIEIQLAIAINIFAVVDSGQANAAEYIFQRQSNQHVGLVHIDPDVPSHA